ncbi:uncharacterized protein LOC124461446 [Drosophila willistoni]|uniref:uncharacterized protein LOC124461446 n=1 Tax=Drosophila willistoni TaxID=7260 RepID=UPI001F084A88|nr:uncharacterized protein LOC124461446 [Drosophila willistoni]
MQTVMQKRGYCKSQITRAYHNANTFIEKAHAVASYDTRLQQLQENYLRFLQLTEELHTYKDTADWEDPDVDIDPYEEKHYATYSMLSVAREELQVQYARSLNNRFSVTEAREGHVSQTHVNLHYERIKLPTFSGNYEDWQHFSDMFVGSIGSDPHLTSCQKFHYLKSYLSGEAFSLIKHIAVTNDNYSEAWDRLVQRYNKRHVIIRSFIDSFLNLPTASVLNSGAIRKLADGADEVIRGLRALECENRDPWLIHVLLAKVDNNTRQAWAEHSESEDYTVTIDSFIKFLLSRGDTLESSQLSRANHSRRIATTHHVNTETQPLIEPCTLCQHAHPLSRCEQFRALDAVARHAHVRSANLCFNCLSPNHRTATCPSKNTCRVCQRKHNTLIHAAQQTTGREFRDSAVRVHQPESPGSNDESPAIISHHVQTTRSHQIAVTKHSKRVSLHTLENIPYTGSQTLLPTILTSVKDARGKTFTCRALLDTGSTVSLATESFVQRIGMRRTHAKVPVRGLAANRAGVTRGLVKFRICSCNSDHNIEVETYILSTLTSALPAQNVDMSSTQWKEILKSPLADPSFGTVGAVDVIFGSDQLWKFCTGEQRSFGPYSTFGENQSLAITHHVHLDLDSQVRSFMEIDSIPSKTSTLEIFDPTEQHFINTHTRSQTGTYVVEYPFKDPMPPIGETLPQAISRLQSLERKFSRDPSLKREYIAFMDEYLKSDHMELLNTQQIDEQPDGCFYLPHHAVLKPESTTTKCRVVFDGSGKDSSGVSINERLHIGPPIQRDLFGVCLRFRQHRYVCCMDIEKMFRKIEVAPHHTNYQRIIWRSSTMDPWQHYRLRTVTYGLAPSPFLAVRVLKQLAIDYEAKYPLAARVLARDAYVDDIPTGCNSVGELMKLKEQLISLLDEGNFKLRKWSSNSWSFLKSIPKEDCLHGHASIEDNVKILGIPWNPAFKRFISRRTRPTDLYSDNGTTFHGSRRALDEMRRLAIDHMKDKELASFAASEGLTWHFIPPLARHFGGIWESGVRSVKLHLRRVIGANALTFEELSTV